MTVFIQKIFTGDNQQSNAVFVAEGDYNIHIEGGTFVATVSLERAPGTIGVAPTTADFVAVATYTAVSDKNGTEVVGAWYRWDIPTGSYTSGNPDARLYQA